MPIGLILIGLPCVICTKFEACCRFCHTFRNSKKNLRKDDLPELFRPTNAVKPFPSSITRFSIFKPPVILNREDSFWHFYMSPFFPGFLNTNIGHPPQVSKPGYASPLRKNETPLSRTVLSSILFATASI